VSGAQLCGFVPGHTLQGCQSTHFKVAVAASHWQCVEELIDSGLELHTSCTRSKRLTIWHHLAGANNINLNKSYFMMSYRVNLMSEWVVGTLMFGFQMKNYTFYRSIHILPMHQVWQYIQVKKGSNFPILQMAFNFLSQFISYQLHLITLNAQWIHLSSIAMLQRSTNIFNIFKQPKNIANHSKAYLFWVVFDIFRDTEAWRHPKFWTSHQKWL